jgi:hypothetical protein
MKAKLIILLIIMSSIQIVITAPGKRIGPSMVYDPVGERVLLYGGAHWQNRYTFYGELWSFEYSTRSWTKLETINNPPPRFNTMLEYLPERHQLFLFGGFSEQDRIRDTWLFDINTDTWIELHPSESPNHRSDSAITYDPINDVIVLFGGYLRNDTSSQETWIYSFEDENWIKKEPIDSPLHQYGGFMVYVESTGQLLMYPGHWSIYSGGNTLDHGFGGNLWEYDFEDNSWTELIGGDVPPGRYWGNLVFDSREDRLILFGGHGAVNYDDTWIYNIEDEVWEMVDASVRPSKRSSLDFVYDPDNHVVVLFGGFSESRDSLGDTWILDCSSLSWYLVETDLSVDSDSNGEIGIISGFPVWSIAVGSVVINFLHYLKKNN